MIELNKRRLVDTIVRYIRGGGNFRWEKYRGVRIECTGYHRCLNCPINRTRLEPAKYPFIPYRCFKRLSIEEEEITMEDVLNRPEIKRILLYMGLIKLSTV